MQSTTLPNSVSQTEPRQDVFPQQRHGVLRALYAFDGCTPDRLIRICRLLQERGFTGDSAAYVMPHSGRFYLSVEERLPHTADRLLPPTLLLEEFGTRIASASLLCCLGEHARCLCEHDAVASLAALTI